MKGDKKFIIFDEVVRLIPITPTWRTIITALGGVSKPPNFLAKQK